MRYKPLPASFYKKNRKKLIEKVLPDSLVLIAANEPIISKGDQYFPFIQNPNFFCLTGLEIEKAILALCPQHPSIEYREVLFVPTNDEKNLRWTGKPLSDQDIFLLSGIERIVPISQFNSYLKEMTLHSRYIYLDVDTLIDDNLPSNPNVRLLKHILSSCPFHKIESVKPLLSSMRIIKSEEELQQIKHAIEITEKAFFELIPLVRPDCYEYQIEASILASFLSRGADGYAFHPIIASSENATILHYFKNHSRLKPNNLLLIDMGASYGNYCADLSRTVPISKHFSDRQRQIYQVVLEVLEFATSLFTPGNTIEQINKEVLKYLEKPMVDLNLLTFDELKSMGEKAIRKFFMHGVSHFIGLEVHDVGSNQTPFQPGMVLTCEPGLYIDAENLGIRLENMLLITRQAPIVLTSNVPLHPDEIEKLMS